MHCGASGDIDCCGSQEVPGGSFDRLNMDELPATVSPFRLDLFEVTQGRFRQFLDAYPGSLPSEGEGAHFGYPDSGWRTEWNALLPPDAAALSAELEVGVIGHDCLWGEHSAEHDSAPMECAPWLVAFAFCVWDGGRLPTETEWNYVASGGDEQRLFPWGDAPYDTDHAVYLETADGKYAPVGSVPAGRARWGQYDLGGSRVELVLDYASGGSPLPAIENMPNPCDDCVQMTPMVSDNRAAVDISYSQAAVETTVWPAFPVSPEYGQAGVGFRCVYLGE